MPKRLRIYFRFDRRLLGALCHIAYESVRSVIRLRIGDDTAVPGMVATVQTFGDLIHWHPHVHAIMSEGVFRKDGTFVKVPELDLNLCVA